MIGIRERKGHTEIFREFGKDFGQRGVVVDELARGPCGQVGMFRGKPRRSGGALAEDGGLAFGQDQAFFVRPHGREKDLARDNAYADGVRASVTEFAKVTVGIAAAVRFDRLSDRVSVSINLKAGSEDFDEAQADVDAERSAAIVADIEVYFAGHLDQTVVFVALETEGRTWSQGHGRGIREGEGLGNIIGHIVRPRGSPRCVEEYADDGSGGDAGYAAKHYYALRQP